MAASTHASETIRRAHQVHPISALQTEYSIWTRDVEKDILDTCRELGVGFVAYSPLGRGFLTGKIKSTDDLEDSDYRKKGMPRFEGDNLKKNLEIIRGLEKVAEEKGCSLAQLAIAWLLARGEDIVPIAGTKRIRYLEENLKALDVTLTADDMDEIDDIAPIGAAEGTRYPEQAMSIVNG